MTADSGILILPINRECDMVRFELCRYVSIIARRLLIGGWVHRGGWPIHDRHEWLPVESALRIVRMFCLLQT